MKLLKKFLTPSSIKALQDFRKVRHFWSLPNERLSVLETLSAFSQKTGQAEKVLDVGAGLRPYEDLFQHCTYHSCDIENAFFELKHDYICTSENIPVEDASYDKVLLIQVLEHIEYPIKTMKEVCRILKPGGMIYLSVPQGAGDHFSPYHFYNFTQFGLKSVLRDSGFEIDYHYRLDGIFTYVANRLAKIGPILEESHANKWYCLPFIKLVNWFFCFTGLLISKLNFLDKKRHYCIENIMWARKI